MESPFKEGVAQRLAPPSAGRLWGKRAEARAPAAETARAWAGLRGVTWAGVPSRQAPAQVTRIPSGRGGPARQGCADGAAPQWLPQTLRPPRAGSGV